MAPQTDEQLRRFQALTLQLSRDLSEVDRACREGRDALEQERLGRLRGLPQLKSFVDKQNQEMAAAVVKRDKAVLDAGHRALVDEADARLGRREDGTAGDRAMKAADARAVAALDEARRKAGAKYSQAIDAARARGLDEQPALRRDAEAVYRDEIAAASGAYRRALQGNQEGRRAALQQAQDAEAAARQRTGEQVAWLVEAAERTFEAELTAIQTRFLAAASGTPEGAAIDADIDRRATELRAHCAGRSDALREAFRRARRELEIY